MKYTIAQPALATAFLTWPQLHEPGYSFHPQCAPIPAWNTSALVSLHSPPAVPNADRTHCHITANTGLLSVNGLLLDRVACQRATLLTAASPALAIQGTMTQGCCAPRTDDTCLPIPVRGQCLCSGLFAGELLRYASML